MQSRSRYLRAIPRLALAVAVFGLAGCGGDDDPTGPVNAEIAGEWILDITGTDDTGRVCNVTDITLTFVRNGGTIDGIAAFGGTDTIVCTPGGTTHFTGSSALDDIVENGGDVAFTFTSNSGLWDLSGEFTGSGNSMSGAVTFFLVFTLSGTESFTGTWSATRT